MTNEINMPRKPQSVIVRRWFQSSYGNTYHSAEIQYSDGTSEKSGMEYGYGDQGLYTALGMLGMTGRDTVPTIYFREQGINYSIVDVARKRDL